jgi:hypothetical protein
LKYFPKGAGSIFTFEIKGGAREAKGFIDSCRFFLLANVADGKIAGDSSGEHHHSQMNEEELCFRISLTPFGCLLVQSTLTIFFMIWSRPFGMTEY